MTEFQSLRIDLNKQKVIRLYGILDSIISQRNVCYTTRINGVSDFCPLEILRNDEVTGWAIIFSSITLPICFTLRHNSINWW